MLYIKFLNWEINKSGKIQSIEKKLDMLQANEYALRPSLEFLETLGDDGQRIKVYPVSVQDIYELAKYSDTLGIILGAVKTEVFRNGFEIIEKFVQKCSYCSKKYQHEDKNNKCDECGGLLINPDVTQKKRLEEWTKRVNINNQSLLEVLKNFEDDLNIIDDSYLLNLYDYYFDENGRIIGKKLVDTSRASPLFVRIVVNKQGIPSMDESGQYMYFCVNHRDKIVRKKKEGEYFCNIDKKQLVKPYYSFSLREQVVNYSSSGGMRNFYSEDEIIHVSKYRPSMTYGHSRIIMCWQKVITLLNMDRYMMIYYQKQRPPKGILTARTTNIESLQKAWYNMIEKAKVNPHSVYFLPVENAEGKGGGNFVNYVDMMKTLDEMQYIEARNEMRRQIGALFGVSPVFQGEVGANMTNQGLQIAVTSKAVEDGQKIYNEKVFVKLMKALNITDYEIKLLPNEQRDEMAEKQLEGIKIDNALKMRSLGFQVKLNEEGDFEYEDADPLISGIQPQNSNPFMQSQGFPEANAPKPQPQNFDGEPANLHSSQQQLTDGMPMNVNRSNLKKNFQINPYSVWSNKFGDSAQGVGWISKEEQESRFLNLINHIQDLDNVSILDVGCGYGHLKEYIGKNSTVKYEGIDILDEYVDSCKSKGYNVRKEDMSDISGIYDYCILSGSLNFQKGMTNKPTEYAMKIIESMWNSSRKGIAFNFLKEDSTGDYDLLNSKTIFEFCKELCPEAQFFRTIHKDFIVKMNKTPIIIKLFNEYTEECKKENNSEFVIKDEDSKDLIDFIEDDIFTRTFDGLTLAESNKAKKILLNAIEGHKTNTWIKEKLKFTINKEFTEEDIDRIVRTETTALRNKAREFTFRKLNPDDDWLYTWVNPNDRRTTETCKHILNRTKEGVKLDKLKQIIDEEGSKVEGFTPRDFLAHYGCRSTFVRSFKGIRD